MANSFSSTTSSSYQCRIAIVGAGLGGLAAAIGIALAGHRVTILEHAAELGEVNDSHNILLASFCSLKNLSFIIVLLAGMVCLYRLALVSRFHQTPLVFLDDGVFFLLSTQSPSDPSTQFSDPTEMVQYFPVSTSSRATKNASAHHTCTSTALTSTASSSPKRANSALPFSSTNLSVQSILRRHHLQWQMGACLKIWM